MNSCALGQEEKLKLFGPSKKTYKLDFFSLKVLNCHTIKLILIHLMSMCGLKQNSLIILKNSSALSACSYTHPSLKGPVYLRAVNVLIPFFSGYSIVFLFRFI